MKLPDWRTPLFIGVYVVVIVVELLPLALLFVFLWLVFR